MTKKETHIYQIQGIADKAFKQALNDQGQPISSLIALDDWKNLKRLDSEYPEQLYQFLFGDDDRLDALERLVLQLVPTSQTASVRQVLGVTDKEDAERLDWLHLLPWEALLWAFWQRSDYDDFAEWMASDACIHLIRSHWKTTEPQDGVKPADIGWSLNVLFASAEPPSQAKLYADDQINAIHSAIESIQNSDYPTLNLVSPLKQATMKQITDAISDPPSDAPYHIIHLIAHGIVGDDGVGRLVLLDESGNESYENVTRLKDAIQQYVEKVGSYPLLLIISACFSDNADYIRVDDSVARTLAETGIPYVIANQQAARVGEIQSFMQAFYQQVALWQPIHKAVMAGRRAILLDHDKEPLNPITRSLSEPYTKRPKLIDTQDGMPGWMVPVVYMQRSLQGQRLQWTMPRYIVWPLDGKVMVRIDWNGETVYVDETMVTEAQYNNQEVPSIPDDLKSIRYDLDNGIPKNNVSARHCLDYATRNKKRLVTIDLWVHLAEQDPQYDDEGKGQGISGHSNRTRGDVRDHKNHEYLWDFAGNLLEIVATSDPDKPQYHRVSSSYSESTLRAYRERDLNTALNKTISNVLFGFRTMIKLDDIAQLSKEHHIMTFHDSDLLDDVCD